MIDNNNGKAVQTDIERTFLHELQKLEAEKYDGDCEVTVQVYGDAVGVFRGTSITNLCYRVMQHSDGAEDDPTFTQYTHMLNDPNNLHSLFQWEGKDSWEQLNAHLGSMVPKFQSWKTAGHKFAHHSGEECSCKVKVMSGGDQMYVKGLQGLCQTWCSYCECHIDDYGDTRKVAAAKRRMSSERMIHSAHMPVCEGGVRQFPFSCPCCNVRFEDEAAWAAEAEPNDHWKTHKGQNWHKDPVLGTVVNPSDHIACMTHMLMRNVETVYCLGVGEHVTTENQVIQISALMKEHDVYLPVKKVKKGAKLAITKHPSLIGREQSL